MFIDFPIETTISRGFPLATYDDTGGYTVVICKWWGVINWSTCLLMYCWYTSTFWARPEPRMRITELETHRGKAALGSQSSCWSGARNCAASLVYSLSSSHHCHLLPRIPVDTPNYLKSNWTWCWMMLHSLYVCVHAKRQQKSAASIDVEPPVLLKEIWNDMENQRFVHHRFPSKRYITVPHPAKQRMSQFSKMNRVLVSQMEVDGDPTVASSHHKNMMCGSI